MKYLKLFEQFNSLQAYLENLRPQLAQAAQNVYDEWEQDEEGVDMMYGTGGICDDIADAMGALIEYPSFTHYDEQATHTSLYVYNSPTQELYQVDIPPHRYEKGYGYNWTKIPNVKFTPDYIEIDPADWESFMDEDGNPLESY